MDPMRFGGPGGGPGGPRGGPGGGPGGPRGGPGGGFGGPGGGFGGPGGGFRGRPIPPPSPRFGRGMPGCGCLGCLMPFATMVLGIGVLVVTIIAGIL